MSIDINSARRDGERGVALVTTMLVLMLMSALLIGLTTVVSSDQRYRSIDRDRYRAFYAAQSGLEKLTSDLGNLFFTNLAPTGAQIGALANGVPSIPDVTFATTGDAAYGVVYKGSSSGTITTGPYQGLIALKKTYELNSDAATIGGGEAHLKRTIETVAIPVFQFGMFSDVDLSFHAGPDFNFGGRVHTNANLFLAEGNGSTLTLPDKVTAVKEIIRQRLVNGVTLSTASQQGTIKMATGPNSFRNLAATEGSLVDGVGSAANPNWPTLSLSTYNGYIRTGKTGAKTLNLPLITTGGANTDLVRRPPAGEDVSNPTLLAERYFSKASLRILLSDTAADITSLPGVTSAPPVSLDGNWTTTPPNNGTAYGPVDATHPPIARSPGLTTATLSAAVTTGTPKTIGVNAIPSMFKIPASLSTTDSGGNVFSFSCTGRTPTTFTGCTAAASHTVNNTTSITGSVAAVNGSVIAATKISGTQTIKTTSTTVTVVDTTPFAPREFWVENTTGSNVLVSCTGYDTTPQFTGCNVTTALTKNGIVTTAAAANAATGVIGGFIKVERQNVDGTWTDVTMEILNYGIGAPNLAGAGCGDPTPNAILRIQRLRDNALTAGACGYAGSIKAEDYWPQTLFDTREGVQRNLDPGTAGMVRLGGVMHYVALDVGNLSRWFAGTAPFDTGTGTSALSSNGFSVYFSDRRNNRNAASQETGEYGFEDVVNPADANGTPNGALDAGEDVNANGTLETYGEIPAYNGTYNSAPPGALAGLDKNARPWTDVDNDRAMVNRAILFRRALKLMDGSLGNIVAPGLTIAAENPIYVQGDWNANQSGFGDPHVATSIAADAVTLLSNNWNDTVSFTSPYSPGNRPRSTQSYYRFAVIAGKNAPFPKPSAATDADFGTDGGAHNFLRMLETGGTVNYRGSIATFFYSRQAVGTYKVGVVYGAPTRNYNFDTDFLDPAKLPPLTPVFRDLNALGFTQEIRPGK